MNADTAPPKAKVMLVEDDNSLRQIYADTLTAEGFTVVSAPDGEAALALAVKEKPDLIVADIMMPKVSGFDMIDILRSTPETKDAKIIMMTALSQAEDKQRAEQLGADKYLVKSQVTIEDFAQVVRDMLTQTEAETNTAVSSMASDSNLAPAKPPTVTPPASADIPVATPPSPTPEPTATDAPVLSSSNGPTPIPVQIADKPSDNTTQVSDTTKPTAATPNEDEMKGQIDQFIASNPTLSSSAEAPKPANGSTTPKPATSIPVTTPDEPAGTPGTATEAKIEKPSTAAADAVDKLMADTNGTDKDEPQAAAKGYVSAQDDSSEPQQSMAHTKRIEPISDVNDTKPDISQLLSANADHEEPAPPPVNTVIQPNNGSSELQAGASNPSDVAL